MEKINITGNPDTNVDWYADGECVNAAVLNRPIKQLAGFINTLIDNYNGKLDYFELPPQLGQRSWYKIAEMTTNIGP